MYGAPIGAGSTFQNPEEAAATVEASVLRHFMVQIHGGWARFLVNRARLLHLSQQVIQEYLNTFDNLSPAKFGRQILESIGN